MINLVMGYAEARPTNPPLKAQSKSTRDVKVEPTPEKSLSALDREISLKFETYSGSKSTIDFMYM